MAAAQTIIDLEGGRGLFDGLIEPDTDAPERVPRPFAGARRERFAAFEFGQDSDAVLAATA